jgi:ABC-type cobalamin/Fe3+-siderophores transport system ATPase subunit
MIAFREVVIRYPGAKTHAVDGVSFDVVPGRITALAGPNGSGKSTLVRALVRRVDLIGGAITLGERTLGDITIGEIGRLAAVLPQREETAFPLGVHEFV